jgi:ATPase subunit of ABC transporter with duplicated ATPase domains
MKEIMFMLQGVSYAHPDREILFDNIDLTVNKQDKAALIGNNGAGKSTLLKIMAGILPPASGSVRSDSRPYYMPQVLGQFNGLTVAQALGIDARLKALQEILAGNVTEANMALLNDDWSLEERCGEALAWWGLENISLTTGMASLSGGQKTKVFLSGITIHQPEIVLLDEPSNHLDKQSRQRLYEYIQSCKESLVVVSHDRTLLNLLAPVYELTQQGITVYGGKYDFYAEQKAIEAHAFNEDLKSKEKELRKARETARETLERQQKLDARGKKKQEKAGLPTIAMNTLRNNAEKSTSRIKDVHSGKIDAVSNELAELRKQLPGMDKMKMGFADSELHKGKVLITAGHINFSYGELRLWEQSLSFVITSGARIAIEGDNGSGKTTLVKLMLGELQPRTGTISRADVKTIYIDQDYSLVYTPISIYEQAQKFNSGNLEEHEVKSRLTRFLFPKQYWDKSCLGLSGGEKMRLTLCCLSLSPQPPDMIILDEPTNNLDIQNIEILTAAIDQYQGTIAVISHDAHFLKQLRVDSVISLA